MSENAKEVAEPSVESLRMKAEFVLNELSNRLTRDDDERRFIVNRGVAPDLEHEEARMSDKKKFPHVIASAVAAELLFDLGPSAHRMAVAGSIRRLKPTVGDIELLFIPRLEQLPARDLFGQDVPVRNLAEEVIAGWLARGVLKKRLNVNGSEMWGDKNKLAVHDTTGIPVDLFAATEANWFNYLVCRTGPGESNIRIAEAARRKGWMWNPYGEGFSRGVGLGRERIGVTSEREVFEFVGLPYLEPEKRT